MLWCRRTGAQVAYTIELPDDGREFGFLLPAARAPRVGEEIWTALTTLALHTLASTDTRDDDISLLDILSWKYFIPIWQNDFGLK